MNLLRWFRPGQQAPSVAEYNDNNNKRYATLVTLANDAAGSGQEVNIPDGQDVALGTTTDTAVSTDAAGTVNAHLRGIIVNLLAVLKVGGNVAAGVVDSGNPVKVGGKYNSAAPTLTDGQRGDAQLDVNANLKTTDPTLSKGSGVIDATTQRVVLASDGPTVTVLGGTTDAAVSTDANGSINAHLRGIVVNLLAVLKVGGNVASAAADSGNPVKIGGKYNLAAVTLTDGQRGDIQVDANGYLKIVEQYSPKNEINTGTLPYSRTRESCSFLNISASGVVMAGAGFLYGFIVNSTSSGTIKLWDNASAGSGTVICNTITPAAGAVFRFPAIRVTNGVFATIGGTLDVTLLYDLL